MPPGAKIRAFDPAPSGLETDLQISKCPYACRGVTSRVRALRACIHVMSALEWEADIPWSLGQCLQMTQSGHLI